MFYAISGLTFSVLSNMTTISNQQTIKTNKFFFPIYFPIYINLYELLFNLFTQLGRSVQMFLPVLRTSNQQSHFITTKHQTHLQSILYICLTIFCIFCKKNFYLFSFISFFYSAFCFVSFHLNVCSSVFIIVDSK